MTLYSTGDSSLFLSDLAGLRVLDRLLDLKTKKKKKFHSKNELVQQHISIVYKRIINMYCSEHAYKIDINLGMVGMYIQKTMNVFPRQCKLQKRMKLNIIPY